MTKAPFTPAAAMSDVIEESYARAQKDKLIYTSASRTQIAPLVGMPEFRMRLRGRYAVWSPEKLHEVLEATTALTSLPHVPAARGMDTHYFIAEPNDYFVQANPDMPREYLRDHLVTLTQYEPGEDVPSYVKRAGKFRPRTLERGWRADLANAGGILHDALLPGRAGRLRLFDMLNAADDETLIDFFRACRALLAEGYLVDFRGANSKLLYGPIDLVTGPKLASIRQIDNSTPYGKKLPMPEWSAIIHYASGEHFLIGLECQLGLDKSLGVFDSALRTRYQALEEKVMRCMRAADYPITLSQAAHLIDEGNLTAIVNQVLNEDKVEHPLIHTPGSANHVAALMYERLQANRQAQYHSPGPA